MDKKPSQPGKFPGEKKFGEKRSFDKRPGGSRNAQGEKRPFGRSAQDGEKKPYSGSPRPGGKFGEKRDGRPGGSIHMAQGMDVGALPSGRLSGAPLSDGGISPCTGSDTRGPTCVMASVGNATDAFKTIRSAVLNQKMPQNLLNTPEERDKFVSLLEAYFEGYNGYQVQWNIQNRETYEDAMVNPQNHRDLIVRVGGFSAYYTELSKALQQQIIDRTEQTL